MLLKTEETIENRARVIGNTLLPGYSVIYIDFIKTFYTVFAQLGIYLKTLHNMVAIYFLILTTSFQLQSNTKQDMSTSVPIFKTN